MTWKTAIAGVPFGGAKGGINAPGSELERDEVEEITRSFIDKIDKRSHDDLPLRVAAYQVGIERVVEAARLRGYI